MSEILYSQADIKDIPLLTTARITFLIEYLGPQQSADIKSLEESLNKYFHENLNKKYICWFATCNEEIVGIGGMSIRVNPGNFRNPSGRVGYIMNMYTPIAWRNKGIAGTLLKKLIDTGKNLDISTFELHATKAGEPLYKKFGFLLHNEPTYRLSI